MRRTSKSGGIVLASLLLASEALPQCEPPPPPPPPPPPVVITPPKPIEPPPPVRVNIGPGDVVIRPDRDPVVTPPTDVAPPRTTPATGSRPVTGGTGRVPTPFTGPIRTAARPRTGGIPLPTHDPTAWHVWWKHNRWTWLRLKDSVYAGPTVTGSDDYVMGRGLTVKATDALRPSTADKRRIVAGLTQLIAHPRTLSEVATAAIVSLGRVREATDVFPLLLRQLRSPDRQRVEAATLALGLKGSPRCAPELLHLATDSSQGRQLVGKRSVPFRVQAKACYALGHLCSATNDDQLRQRVFDRLAGRLASTDTVHRDVRVAALLAIRQITPRRTYAGQKLLHRALGFLAKHVRRRDIPAQVRAHAITAIADLAGRNGPRRFVDQIRAVLDRRERSWLQQSAALALGRMLVPDDADGCDTLRAYVSGGRDAQARYFAAISLGQIGGARNRDLLLRKFVSSRTNRMLKTWIALGLAICDRVGRDRDGANPDTTAADAIARELAGTRNTMDAAGYAVALGLMRYDRAGSTLLERLRGMRGDDAAAGHTAIALGLMGHVEATDTLRKLALGATRRPALLGDLSIALALLNDKRLTPGLIERMRNTSSRSSRRSLTEAIGLIGDRRSIPELARIATDRKLSSAAQRLGAVALGLVGDTQKIAWNRRISIGLNYRANVETLTGSDGQGVLDLP